MNVTLSFSLPPDLAQAVDKRSRELGMTRSQYIVQLLRAEVLSGKPTLSIVSEQSAPYAGTDRSGKPTRRKQ